MKIAQKLVLQLIRRLPMGPRRQFLYLHYHHRWPSLRHPMAMTEKVNWRVVKDRRPLLAWTCDKLAMKRMAAELCPDVKIAEVLWRGIDVRDLREVELPDRWVLKPNHRSELIYFGEGPVTDTTLLESWTRGWLEEANYKGVGEWAYGQADRVLFVEEALGDAGSPPNDYKFYTFDGVVRLIQVESDRFNANHARAHYDAEWNEVDLAVALPNPRPMPRPKSLDQMLRVAQAIGAPFDFIRVDLYDVGGEVFFGEVTPYPASGHGPYDPRSMDYTMGGYWTLPSDV